ncbi:MAG: hypothetical protein MUE55_07585, partial [Thermoplasmata archaeon]|nr:hypothetical protein [Thermoplasmata archaeon]
MSLVGAVARIGPVAILKKGLTVVAVFYLILTVIFIAIRVSPSGATHMLPPPAGPYVSADEWRIVEDLRLNYSLAMQYIDFLSDTTRGDLSISLTGDEVSDILPDYAAGTIFLLLSVLLLSVVIGTPISMHLSRGQDRLSARTISVLSILIAAIPASGLGVLLLLMNPMSAAETATMTDADILRQPIFHWHSWTSMVSMVRSSGIPLLGALVPTLGMYILLFHRGRGGMARAPASPPAATHPRGIRAYVTTVLGPTMPLPLFFVSWAMCCVIAAENSCSFDGLGTMLWYAANHGDPAVMTAAVVAMSTIVLVTILSVQFVVWFASHGACATGDSQSFPPSAAAGPPSHPARRHLGMDEVLAFVRGVLVSYRRSKPGMTAMAVFALLCVLALLAPRIVTLEDPWLDVNRDDALLPPSVEPSEATGIVHIFGTDILGRDMYSMVLLSIGAT